MNNIPPWASKSIDLSSLKDKLTWYPANLFQKRLPYGSIILDEDDELWLVGNATPSVEDLGCGCCALSISSVSIAFLQELLS